MNHRLIQHMVAIGAACLAFACVCAPARAQMIVYDPSNYAQNVLRPRVRCSRSTTRSQSAKPGQMLLNQAKNLAGLPYSSLQTIEQSLARTQQLLNEAQRLGYDVNQIDQAFQRLYPQSYTGASSSQQLVAMPRSAGRTRWRLTRMRCGCKPVWWGISTRRAPRPTRSSPRASPPWARCKRLRLATNWSHCRPDSSPI